MLNKIKNAVNKTTGAVTSSITYNTMTSYAYIGKKKVDECKGYVKEHPVAATAKVINGVTTKTNPASIIKHAAIDCAIDAAVNKRKNK